MPASAPTLAIVRLSALGDLLHALPAAYDLRSIAPRSRLIWIAQREFLPVLEGLPWLDRAIPFDRRRGWPAWLELRRRCREESIDLALDLQGNWKSAIAARLSGARERLGLARAERREPGCGVLFHRLAEPSPSPHAIDRARHAVASWFGVAPPRAPVDWRVVLPSAPADVAEAQRMAVSLELPEAGDVVFLLPTARPDLRSWPLSSWIETARLLAAEPGLLPIVMTGPSEAALGSKIASELESDGPRGRRVRHRIGQRGARAAIALFRLLRERTRAAIACDGGALHLAVAGELRAIALAGPQDPLRTGPYGDGHIVLSAPNELACRPCLRRRCQLDAGPRCLDELTPLQVAGAVRSLAAR